eukprot:CAMPEP_0117432170 /NCGR_PEP_ID=MMETSP0758-20121206/11704_1 /TAXON_ID=63605 /ORGANISM="Percolomonas cosmopolitus, Strain AE-1 (ATCC 50343)" /LENGTH=883 /DNA_ID=CAMNT_0005221911 /DNA_START=294 /DNA_END=2946 /DNA_ORIENTATION=+
MSGTQEEEIPSTITHNGLLMLGTKGCYPNHAACDPATTVSIVESYSEEAKTLTPMGIEREYGVIGKARSLNKTEKVAIKIEATANKTLNDFTVSMWFKPIPTTVYSNDTQSMTNGTQSMTNGTQSMTNDTQSMTNTTQSKSMLIDIPGDAGNYIRIALVTDTDEQVRFRYEIKTNIGDQDYEYHYVNMTEDGKYYHNWHHIAFARRGSDVYLYLNGTQIYSTMFNADPIVIMDSDIAIGTSTECLETCNNTVFFNGAIDEIAIFDAEFGKGLFHPDLDMTKFFQMHLRQKSIPLWNDPVHHLVSPSGTINSDPSFYYKRSKVTNYVACLTTHKRGYTMLGSASQHVATKVTPSGYEFEHPNGYTYTFGYYGSTYYYDRNGYPGYGRFVTTLRIMHSDLRTGDDELFYIFAGHNLGRVYLGTPTSTRQPARSYACSGNRTCLSYRDTSTVFPNTYYLANAYLNRRTYSGSPSNTYTAYQTSTSARFRNPSGMCIDPSDTDTMYIVDQDGKMLRRAILSQRRVYSFSGVYYDEGNVDAAGKDARFIGARECAFDSLNRIWVNQDDGKIKTVMKGTAAVTTMFDLGLATNHMIIINDVIYISDPSYRIGKITGFDNITLTWLADFSPVAGSTYSSIGSWDTTNIHNMKELWNDKYGNIYVSTGNEVFRSFETTDENQCDYEMNAVPTHLDLFYQSTSYAFLYFSNPETPDYGNATNFFDDLGYVVVYTDTSDTVREVYMPNNTHWHYRQYGHTTFEGTYVFKNKLRLTSLKVGTEIRVYPHNGLCRSRSYSSISKQLTCWDHFASDSSFVPAEGTVQILTNVHVNPVIMDKIVNFQTVLGIILTIGEYVMEEDVVLIQILVNVNQDTLNQIVHIVLIKFYQPPSFI